MALFDNLVGIVLSSERERYVSYCHFTEESKILNTLLILFVPTSMKISFRTNFLLAHYIFVRITCLLFFYTSICLLDYIELLRPWLFCVFSYITCSIIYAKRVKCLAKIEFLFEHFTLSASTLQLIPDFFGH